MAKLVESKTRKNEKTLKINMTFEKAMKKALNTSLKLKKQKNGKNSKK